MSLVVFVGVHLVGDPVHILISDEMTQAEIDAFIHRLGLDRPVHEQYFHFLGNALRGDLGNSFVFGEPALKLILQRMPATLELAFAAFILGIVVGIPLGMYAGLAPSRRRAGAIGGLDPRLLAADLLGRPGAHHGVRRDARLAALDRRGDFGPGTASALIRRRSTWRCFQMALVTRLARPDARGGAAGLREFARQGLSPARALLVRSQGDIMVPVVTVLGLELGGLIAFSVVPETVFAWPGMGKLLIDSSSLDRPVIVAYLVTLS
jgi:peptide/nickel transport system permease protein